MALTRKSIRIFSAVEALREGQQDIRYALLPIFAPDFSKFDGQIYDPSKVAAEINGQYRLSLTSDIIEQFTPIFCDKGWLALITPEPKVSYRVTCPPKDTIASGESFKANAGALAKTFRQFIIDISPLSQIDTSDENLIEILVDWLVSLDIYSSEDLTNLRRVETIGKKITYTVDAPGERAVSENHYLSARFVSQLMKASSEFVPFLVDLGSVGLITEVVREFQHPSEAVKRTDLVIYLDAPVALDYLGLSGAASQDNIKTILSKVVPLGASLRIFRLSVDEMQSSLRALLQRSPAERTGPTARALQKQEVVEAYIRQVATSPDGIIQSAGIGIVDQGIDQFPNEHKFFPESDIHQLYSKIGWVDSDAAKWHDAVAAALITRKRAGQRSNDLFATKHVLVTRNPFFGPKARSFSLDRAFIGPNHVGPVVHQRDFATSVWLRAGLGVTDQEIPRKYILSACQRVLTVSKNVVAKVREVSRNLTVAQKAQLELVLGEGRATQVLMDKTLGAASVIDSTNVEVLVAEMRRSIGEEAHAEANEKIKAIRKRGRELEAGFTEKLASLGSMAHELQLRNRQAEEKFAGIRSAVLAKVNARNAKRRMLPYGLLVIIFLVSQVIAAAANAWTGMSAVMISAAGILLASIVQFVKPLRVRFVDPRLAKWDWVELDKLAREFELYGLDELVSYRAGVFELLPPLPIEANTEGQTPRDVLSLS